jgi:hypothetical protein
LCTGTGVKHPGHNCRRLSTGQPKKKVSALW